MPAKRAQSPAPPPAAASAGESSVTPAAAFSAGLQASDRSLGQSFGLSAQWSRGHHDASCARQGLVPPDLPAQRSVADPTRKTRVEIFVGNLPQIPNNVGEFCMQAERMLRRLPDYVTKYGHDFHPFVALKMPGNKICEEVFTFLTLADERLASTLVQFNGMEVKGVSVKVARPSSYRACAGVPEAPPLDVSELRRLGMLPGASHRSAAFTAASKEVYIRNLAAEITREELVDFLTPLCQEMAREAGLINQDPLRKVTLGPGNKYCFLRLVSASMATWLLEVLHELPLCGQTLECGRPRSYYAELEAITPVGPSSNNVEASAGALL
eukprot:TRINITY_DN23337_c0_g1_i1.p1 TRINITY_DN23337_c0_g1~~TRINITY_DN23337_c0_g1_i1.p1  ORF type:complete len:326 (-),score=70.81 TRINITY_DN23337_c0_g1_i1:80-1057(-)